MSYYDTLDEDLKRAREILERGKMRNEDLPAGLSPDLAMRMLAQSGTIHGMDIYASYKLLESFVEAITQLQPWKDAIIDACVVDWILIKEHQDDPRRAVNDLLAWQQKIALDPAVSKPVADLHTEIERLRARALQLVGECRIVVPHRIGETVADKKKYNEAVRDVAEKLKREL